MIVRVDQAILTRIERISHAIQRQTGIDCRALARIVITVFTIEVLWSVLEDGLSGAHFWPNSGLGLFAVIIYIPEILGYHPWSGPRSAEGTANPRKIRPGDVLVRLACLGLCGPEIIGLIIMPDRLLDRSSMLLFTLWQYITACDPLPPCRGRIREAISAFFATPAVNRS